jgi:hypothetical protein
MFVLGYQLASPRRIITLGTKMVLTMKVSATTATTRKKLVSFKLGLSEKRRPDGGR